jgi:hypothetical protein
MPNGSSNTQAPKTGSSQNALKRGFHAVALQPGEDAQEVHDLQQEICTEYAARSKLDRFLVSQIVQNILMLSRIQKYKQDVVNAALYERAAKYDFMVAAQLSALEFLEMPDELLRHDPELVKRGVQVIQALEDISKLKGSMTSTNAPQMLATLSTHSPNFLFELKRLGLVQSADAARFIGGRYGKSHVQDNLKEFTLELIKSNRIAFLWAQNEEKYLAIIASIKAKATLELLKDASLARYETGCFNKIRSVRADLQHKKDAQILEAKAVDVTEHASSHSKEGEKGGSSKEASSNGASSKGASSKGASANGARPKGSGPTEGGTDHQGGDVSDLQDKTPG